METAKDILDNNAPNWKGEDCVPRDQALVAMKEIADKAWEAAWTRFRQEEYGRVPATAPDKSTFMKELFLE